MTFQQPIDFRDESDALHAIVAPLADADYARPTLFKGWTINDVVTHLHFWNESADLSLTDEAAFMARVGKVFAQQKEIGLRGVENAWYGGLSGRALLDTWHDTYTDMAARWAEADPSRRLKWVGPDMSVRSSITARLMETWAHGQAVYDLLGIERIDTDRIRNVAHIGVSTYGWTFANRKEEPPGPPPYVRLTAPSGAIWEWNEPDPENCVSGPATEFCQVVTQCRSIADTSLQTKGEAARRWMEVAQCFAGPVETPPAKGARHKAA